MLTHAHGEDDDLIKWKTPNYRIRQMQSESGLACATWEQRRGGPITNLQIKPLVDNLGEAEALRYARSAVIELARRFCRI